MNREIGKRAEEIEKIIGNFTVKTLAAPINKYNCYELSVKVENDNNKVELNTYVTKK